LQPTNDYAGRSASEKLNQQCVCVTVDRSAIAQDAASQLAGNADEILSSAAWHQLFSDVAVFLSHRDLERMQAIVRALESATALPDYRDQVLSWAPSTASLDPGPSGAFMGYDFHLGKDGPRLIEINTNAGGAFLNAVLARAQRRCCGGASIEPWTEDFERVVIDQFQSEWHSQRSSGSLQRIAIIDDQPEEQYLYPEFRLAQRVLQKSGIDALILSPEALQYETGVLYGDGKPIDLVYNRLVDFALEAPTHDALREAWLDGSTVITPNPRTHALLADKRNLTRLSDPAFLESRGLGATDADLLRESIPTTVRVTADNASTLWQERRQWFFKPVAGHGSKGVYRGSKLTKKTFARILENDYIAQAFVPPSERTALANGERETLKVDVRLYTYRASVLLAAARLYRGQTTNFRTEGGGFAPLLLNK
jgi:hypothetical protein